MSLIFVFTSHIENWPIYQTLWDNEVSSYKLNKMCYSCVVLKVHQSVCMIISHFLVRLWSIKYTMTNTHYVHKHMVIFLVQLLQIYLTGSWNIQWHLKIVSEGISCHQTKVYINAPQCMCLHKNHCLIFLYNNFSMLT